jgi:hypothetical protein
MYFKTLARCNMKGYILGMMVMLLLRKPFISVRWWREIDSLHGVLPSEDRCWIEFSLHKDNGKKI